MRKPHCQCGITLINILILLGFIITLTACGGGSGGVGGNAQAADPTVPQLPIAYVKRPTPTKNGATTPTPDAVDVSDPEAMHPGAHLIVKKNASLSSPEIDITNAIIGDTGDVRDPSFSNDGTKLLFALHKMNVNNANPPITWDIYEYDLTKPLSQVAGSENPKLVMPFNSSDGDDISPHFVPGNRIVFASDRATTTGAIELNESFFGMFKPTVEGSNRKHTFNLYSMAADGNTNYPAGTDIQQLTFNTSDDLYPSIIHNIPGLEGRVLFSRWEHSPGKNQMSLYTMNPDGTDIQMLYGEYSHKTGTNNSIIQFTQPHETSNGEVMALAMPFTGTYDGGDPVLINVQDYSDNTVPVNVSSGLTGPAQDSLSNNTVSTVPGISLGGRYSSVLPLLDGTNRALVSYSLCYVNVTDPTTNTTQTKSCNDPSVNLSDPNTTEAPPRYGIFIYDIGSKTMLPITAPEPDTYYTDVALAQPITDAPYIPNSTTADKTGILDIRSVYDMDGSFSKLNSTDTNLTSLSQLADPAQSTTDKADNPNLIQRPAMFLRIVKGVYMPDKKTDNFKTSAFGVIQPHYMRQIIGYAPIDPDGSVRVEVPANVPLSISVLDKNGRRIGNPHGIWLTVRPGETLSCAGCHSPSSTTPHGRTGADPASINPGATAAEVAAGKFTDTLIAPTQVGQTMAEARTLSGGEITLRPSVDIIFNDVWTDMTTAANMAARTKVDAPFFYEYNWLPVWTSGGSVVAPVSSTCISTWSAACRTTINYVKNIDPMWAYTPRYATDALGNVIKDSNGNSISGDKTCVSCHNTANQANAGYLDLSSTAVSQNMDWLGAYSQLVQSHPEIDASGNNITQPGPIDPTTGLATVVNVMTTPPIKAGSANGSKFFQEFTTTHCTVDSNGVCHPWLNVNELKLLSEWVDIGAQYYNNPFDPGAQ